MASATTGTLLCDSTHYTTAASREMSDEPDFLWVATGGQNGCFNEDAVQVLRGRDVILMPDLGAIEKWIDKSKILEPICKSATISDVLDQMATDEQRKAGLDISDFLLMQETKQMVWGRMIERNPALQQFIDDFDLELIEDDP